MVERQLPKLHTTVRSRSPAPELKSPRDAGFCFLHLKTLGLARLREHFCSKVHTGVCVALVGQVAQLPDAGLKGICDVT
jgi:hypothetical protein